MASGNLRIYEKNLAFWYTGGRALFIYLFAYFYYPFSRRISKFLRYLIHMLSELNRIAGVVGEIGGKLEILWRENGITIENSIFSHWTSRPFTSFCYVSLLSVSLPLSISHVFLSWIKGKLRWSKLKSIESWKNSTGYGNTRPFCINLTSTANFVFYFSKHLYSSELK